MSIRAAGARRSTGRVSATGRREGFTLIELMIVMALIALLASLVSPLVSNAIRRAKEATLQENLYQTRKAIDDYYADRGRYPADLKTLVEARYLRSLPYDPVTGRSDSWMLVQRQVEGEPEATGISDLHSGSQALSAAGTPYSQW